MKEIWRSVKGYEGLYEVSSDGRVRSMPRVKIRSDGKILPIKGCIRKPVCWRGSPYHHVMLCKDGVHKKINIHILVSDAFLGPRPNGADCDHLDHDQLNNKASNLHWTTRSINVRRGRKGKLTKNQVVMIRDMSSKGWTQRELGARFGVVRSHIHKLVHRRQWKDV